MSDMLGEAIVDAKSLRAAALKNAENIVIEKYSTEVRKTLENILEQDEAIPGLDDLDAGVEAPPADEPLGDAAMPEIPMEESPAVEPGEEIVEGDDVPLAATADLADMSGENLSNFPGEGQEVEVTIDLGALQEAVKTLGTDLDEEIEITAEDLANILSEEDDEELQQEDQDPQGAGEMADAGEESAGEGEAAAAETAASSEQDKASGYGGTNENLDSLVSDIVEKLTVDMDSELSGWAGRPTTQLEYEQERALAGAQTEDVKEDLEDLNKAQEELFAENKQLTEQNNQYKQALNELKGSLQEVNLSNARLLYTNRVLRNTSLNERQKDKIVEAISSAGSVAEARTIFDTLQSTVEVAPKRTPKSLGEAISRRSSVIRATRHAESAASDPWSDRMKKLAGIK